MRRSFTVVALIAGIAITTAAAPIVKGWELLGERAVKDRVDHDVISVTAREGAFKQIKLTVHRRGVDFRRVVVHFGNGDDQTINMKGTIRAGGETRAIDLEGAERNIRSVEFWYDSNSRGAQAIVRLYGKS